MMPARWSTANMAAMAPQSPKRGLQPIATFAYPLAAIDHRACAGPHLGNTRTLKLIPFPAESVEHFKAHP